MAPPQQVVMQPVMQPVAPAPQTVAPVQSAEPHGAPEQVEHRDQEVRLYSHSMFYYWWPAWAVGFLCALLTWFNHVKVPFSQLDGSVREVLIHPSANLGVVFTLTLFLVILITNIPLRGMASLVVIGSAAFLTLLFAYLDWWGDILYFLGQLNAQMNLGFYLLFSILLFVVWVFSVFVYDHTTYWKVRPGQMTQEAVIGGAERSFDTRGMVFQKHRDDLFRHWILGLGSGDIEIHTTGAVRETIYVPNVLFVNFKLQQIQRLIAMKPTDEVRG